MLILESHSVREISISSGVICVEIPRNPRRRSSVHMGSVVLAESGYINRSLASAPGTLEVGNVKDTTAMSQVLKS